MSVLLISFCFLLTFASMKTCTSISGGQTSAYLAANYPSDYNVFALVRIEDERCRWMGGKDEVTRRLIEDRIGKPFIGTAEDDMIVYTILDLEQYLGREIKIVTGNTYEQVIRDKGWYLPNISARFCTTEMKLVPIFEWWLDVIGEPIEMRIGYRANELRRVEKMLARRNADGLVEMDYSFGVWEGGAHDGKRKWEKVGFQMPRFPLVEDGVYKDRIVEFWRGKPVRFAEKNNCLGCFFIEPMLLNLIAKKHPKKMDWFARQEEETGNCFKNGVTYRQIMNYKPQLQLSFEDFGHGDDDCDSGHCGL